MIPHPRSSSETGPAWNEFFADRVVCGLTGVRLITSDAHCGLREATAWEAVRKGVPSWRSGPGRVLSSVPGLR
nr:transposase [Kribbella sp. NBC_01484]